MKSRLSEFVDSNYIGGKFPPLYQMIQIQYRQQCSRTRRNSNRNAHYFYLRCKDRSPYSPNLEGEWELPENHLFTCYRAKYDKFEHLRVVNFWVCKPGGQEKNIISSKGVNLFDVVEPELPTLVYYVIGNFDIIVAGIGLTYGRRLMEWWNAGDGSIAYAELCAKYLKPRIKQIPQFELDKLTKPKPQPTDAVLGNKDAAFQKWISTAAVLGGKNKS